jgi:hypothetical protein
MKTTAQLQEEKKKALAAIKPKFYFEIKIESMIPAIITYRILAETAEQAVELMKNQQPVNVSHRLQGRKDIILRVYKAGSCVIEFIKRLAR